MFIVTHIALIPHSLINLLSAKNLRILFVLICFSLSHSYASTPRETIVAAVMEADEVKKNELILSLASTFSEDVPLLPVSYTHLTLPTKRIV